LTAEAKAPSTIWFFSDPHFGHDALVQGHDDKPREFASVEEMGERIVANHNAVVRDHDHWYCLGDVAMKPEFVELWLPRLNGHGRIILGNHDKEEARFYLRFVNKVMAYRIFDEMIFSHIPIAPWSMRWRANVHGHCHLAKPLFYTATNPDVLGWQRPARYINLSAEHVGYRPVSLEQIAAWSRK